MDGLRTARVMVLDNEIKEAKPFMQALAKHGIGTTYFSGDADMLPCPEQKLTGIRLAVLDLDLVGGGEAPAVIGALLTIVNGIIHHENGPYLAIVWTDKDEEYFREFVRRKAEINCQPIRLIKMRKTDYDWSDIDGIDSIFDKVSNAVDQAYPLGLLSFWEQAVHDSSGSVMKILPGSSNWIAQSKTSLRILLDTTSNREDPLGMRFNSLLSALNALQLDAIETAEMPNNGEEEGKLISPLTSGSSSGGNNDLKATLNYRLLCTEAAYGTAPGNIYLSDHFHAEETKLSPSLDDLIADAADPNQSVSQEKLRDAGCVPIGMEITPLCDYQQRARGIPRLICGLAVPIEASSFLKQRSQFLRQTDAIAFDVCPLEGKMSLVWNSHYIISVPHELISDGTGIVRLRQAPLIDVQAWLGSQGNRPGYLSIGVG